MPWNPSEWWQELFCHYSPRLKRIIICFSVYTWGDFDNTQHPHQKTTIQSQFIWILETRVYASHLVLFGLPVIYSLERSDRSKHQDHWVSNLLSLLFIFSPISSKHLFINNKFIIYQLNFCLDTRALDRF